jgi:hypothetical protein
MHATINTCTMYMSDIVGAQLERSVSSSSVQYLHQFRSHGVLVRQEACDVDDGRLDAAADVPPRGGLLGDEHLRAADVVDVDRPAPRTRRSRPRCASTRRTLAASSPAALCNACRRRRSIRCQHCRPMTTAEIELVVLLLNYYIPDSKERQAGTLAGIFLAAGALPTVATGHTVTRSMMCSCANLHASFSISTIETAYACECIVRMTIDVVQRASCIPIFLSR